MSVDTTTFISKNAKIRKDIKILELPITGQRKRVQIKYIKIFQKEFRNILPKMKKISLIYKVIKVTSSTKYSTFQFSGETYTKYKENRQQSE